MLGQKNGPGSCAPIKRQATDEVEKKWGKARTREKDIKSTDSTDRQPAWGERLTTVQKPPQGASGAPRRGCMRNPKRHKKNPNQHEKNPNLQAKP